MATKPPVKKDDKAAKGNNEAPFTPGKPPGSSKSSDSKAKAGGPAAKPGAAKPGATKAGPPSKGKNSAKGASRPTSRKR